MAVEVPAVLEGAAAHIEAEDQLMEVLIEVEHRVLPEAIVQEGV